MRCRRVSTHWTSAREGFTFTLVSQSSDCGRGMERDAMLLMDASSVKKLGVCAHQFMKHSVSQSVIYHWPLYSLLVPRGS